VAPLFLILAMPAMTGSRYGWVGFWNGMALMVKLTSLPAAGVFVAIIAKDVLKKRVTPRKAGRFLIGLSIPLLILLPFLVKHPYALYDGLFVTPALLPVMDVSFVNLLIQAGKWLIDEQVLRHFLQLYSNPVILIASLAFAGIIVWKKDVRAGTSRFLALIALVSFFLPLLAKYTYIDKYTAIGSAFVVLWGASRRPGFPHEAVWFVLLQSFLLDHVPVVWKTYCGLIFYGLVCIYIFYFAFLAPREEDAVLHPAREAVEV